MHVGSDIDVHADVNVIELGVDQGIDTYAANSGLKRTGGHGNALADLQRSLLSVERANLRLLQNSGIAVGVKERRRRRGDRHLEVGRVQMCQAVQVDGARSAARCRLNRAIASAYV